MTSAVPRESRHVRATDAGGAAGRGRQSHGDVAGGAPVAAIAPQQVSCVAAPFPPQRGCLRWWLVVVFSSAPICCYCCVIVAIVFFLFLSIRTDHLCFFCVAPFRTHRFGCPRDWNHIDVVRNYAQPLNFCRYICCNYLFHLRHSPPLRPIQCWIRSIRS